MRITKFKALINKDTNLTELIKDKAVNYSIVNNRLTSPEAISRMMIDLYQLDIQAEEYVYMIAFDTKQKPLGVFEISHGTVNVSILNPREVYLKALLVGAVSIVLLHNHPSGDTSPSREDIRATERIKQAGEMLGIKLIDHIIIGDDYLSFAKESYM